MSKRRTEKITTPAPDITAQRGETADQKRISRLEDQVRRLIDFVSPPEPDRSFKRLPGSTVEEPLSGEAQVGEN